MNNEERRGKERKKGPERKTGRMTECKRKLRTHTYTNTVFLGDRDEGRRGRSYCK